MPIDAGIINNLKPLVLPDVARQFSEGIALGQQRQLHEQQQQMNALKIEQEKRATREADEKVAHQHALTNIYATSGGDRDKTIQGAIDAGLPPDMVQGLQKHYADLDKEAAEMDVKKQETRKAINSQLLPLHDQAIQEAQADPQAFAQKWPTYVATAIQIDPRNSDHLDPSKVPTVQDLMMSRAAHQTIADVDNRADQKRKEQKAAEDAAAAARAAKMFAPQLATAEGEAALVPFKKAEEQAKADQVERENAARANPGDTALQQAALTAAQRTEQARQARVDAETAAQHKVTNIHEEARIGIESRKEAREQSIYDQTYGSGSNEALRTVDPKLRTAATKAAQDAANENIKANRSADEVENFIHLARQGNKAAYANMPIAGVLEITTSNGTTRINRNELEAYGGAGSLFDKLAGKIGKAVSGASIPKDVLDDIEKLHQSLRGGSEKSYKDKLAAINQNYHSDFKSAVGKPSGPSLAVGQIVVGAGGKRIKVTAVHPDGTFDGDEVK